MSNSTLSAIITDANNLDISFRKTKSQKTIKAFAKIAICGGIMTVDNVQVREDKVVWPFTANQSGGKTYYNRDLELDKEVRAKVDKMVMAAYEAEA